MSRPQVYPLPAFTPQAVAQSLRRQEEKSPEPRQQRPTITVDVVSVAKGAIWVGQLLAPRAAHKKARLKQLRVEALELAEQLQGFLGIPDLTAGGRCSREEAKTCLESLESEQFCRFLCHYQDEPLYVFPAFLAKVWSCEYCTTEFAVRAEHRAASHCGCPNCGATMKQVVAVS